MTPIPSKRKPYKTGTKTPPKEPFRQESTHRGYFRYDLLLTRIRAMRVRFTFMAPVGQNS